MSDKNEQHQEEKFDPEMEKMYQAFKERLMRELVAISPHLQTCALIRDREEISLHKYR
jgi:hypothetical protein